MPKVYVVQNQHRWDEESSSFRPKFDLSRAEHFGELVPLLSPTAAPFRTAVIVAELREKLRWYGDDDYLLLIGNPALIGFAVALAAAQNEGRVKLLQWSGTNQEYIVISAELGT